MSEVIFHNTLTRSAEPIQPTKGKTVGMYCCGPTVYAQAHIGNFRTFLLQDVMRRVMQTAGYKVLHVRNLTDVDDKTIAKSISENKPLTEVTEHWTDVFHKDCTSLNLLPPTIEPKATAHIPEQIAMIEALIEKDHAYATEEGSVYFRVSSFEGYGALSRVKERELKTDAADASPIDSDEYERDSMADFVLWKSRKPGDGDVFWESPWGQGRPGWHLECSAMSMKYLKNNLDIHSGGVDLTFPHHENEIAQSECSCGNSIQFFKHWIHCAHLLVDGGKMSKSLNNFYTVDDILEKGFLPVVLRYALTSGHYRQTINFKLDSLSAGQSALQRIKKFSDDILAAAGLKRSALLKEIAKDKHTTAPWGNFEKAWSQLSTDLNIAGALGAIFTELKTTKPATLEAAEAQSTAIAFHKLIFALGYDLEAVTIEKAKGDIPENIKQLAQQRWDAKTAKDWAAADDYRNQLQVQGWKILDQKDTYEIEQT